MYLKSTTRQEMLAQIESLKLLLEQSKQQHDREMRQMKQEHQKEITALQDEIRKTQEIVSNVQFQQFFKMQNENKKLIQENNILRDMVRASQITNSTKDMELQCLRNKVRRLQGHSIEVPRKPQLLMRHYSHHRTEPNEDPKFKINQ